MAKINLTNSDEPSTPNDGLTSVYVDVADGFLKQKDSAGVVTDFAGSAVWGGITGTLSNQADLMAAIAAIGINNLIATTDPTVSDDSTLGYAGGRSIWLNKTSGSLWMCEDATAGAAIWVERPYLQP